MVIQSRFEAQIKRLVLPEKFVGDGFNVKGVFKLCKCGLGGRLQDRQKLPARRVCFFTRADQEGITPRGGERFFDFLLFFIQHIIHTHEGKAPVFRVIGIKGYQRRVLERAAAPAVEIAGDKVPLHRAGVFERAPGGEFNAQDVKPHALRIGEFRQALIGNDAVLKGVGNIFPNAGLLRELLVFMEKVVHKDAQARFVVGPGKRVIDQLYRFCFFHALRPTRYADKITSRAAISPGFCLSMARSAGLM